MSSSKKPTRDRIRVAVIGASGRMGLKVVEVLAAAEDAVARSYTLVWSGSARDPAALKELVGSSPDLVIDFSKPQGTLAWSKAFASARSKKKPAALICATGFDTAELRVLKTSLKGCTWALVPNTSLGVWAVAESLKVLARMLPADYSFSVHETHHAKKVDAPSGTGLMLKSLLEAARPRGSEVTITSARGGSDPGTHTVTILGPFEKIQITHAAEDRRLFARGALVLGLSLLKSHKKERVSIEDLGQ